MARRGVGSPASVYTVTPLCVDSAIALYPFGRRVRDSAEENGAPAGVDGLERDVFRG